MLVNGRRRGDRENGAGSTGWGRIQRPAQIIGYVDNFVTARGDAAAPQAAEQPPWHFPQGLKSYVRRE
jgi:hypothetical protein